MRFTFIIISFLTLFGCAAAGVVHTNDPYTKVSNSYVMMSHGRPIPAERFAKEALSQFKEQGDIFGQGEAHVALGSLYKSEMMKLDTKSIEHYKQAVNSFKTINDYKNTAKSEFALANAYANIGKNNHQCQMYSKALSSYNVGINENPDISFKINPNFKTFEEMVVAFKNEYCK